MPKDKLDEILERHKAFWNMDDVDKPLLRITQYKSGYGVKPPPMRLPLADGTMATEEVFYLEPEMLSPERFSSKDERPSAIPATSGDVFPVLAPFTKVPWMEAIEGCPIRVSLQSSSIWSEPAMKRDWEMSFKALKPMDRWQNKLLEFTEYLSANCGSHLVSNTLMRGPSDMVDALIGEGNLCLGIYENPEKIQELMMICGKIFVNIAQRQLERIKPLGYIYKYFSTYHH